MEGVKQKPLSRKEISEKIFVLVNPVSANSKTEKEWPNIAEFLKNHNINFHYKKSEYPEHSVAIVRNAIKNGYKYIMSVGGDGTINEVVNGFFENGILINNEAKLIIFSRGTGSDFIKSLGIGNSKKDIIKIIKNGKEKLVDLAKVCYISNEGNKAERYFINISDAGLGGETVARVNKSSKFFGGTITYLLGVLKTLYLYKNKKFELIIDGKKVINKKINSVMVANGSYFGGGMKIAPEAVVDNGFLNIVVLGDLSKLEIIKNLYKAYTGSHLSHKKIQSFKGKEVKINSREKVLLNVDGESVGSLPAKFKICPQKLKIQVI